MANKKPRHTYVIGDIQGCYDELRALLDQVKFDADKDRVWFTGDLVSRGPKSLEVLRYVRDLGSSAVTVLGNHDLHLLAAASGITKHRLDPSLNPVIAAEDRDELLNWLRHQPLLHREKRPSWPHEWIMVHAGLAADWSADEAEALSREVEETLQGDNYLDFLDNMYGNKPDKWSPKLKGYPRLRFITNCLTRVRYCDQKGRLLLKEKGAPQNNCNSSIPWFELPDRKHADTGVLCGHWSTLGQVVWSKARVYGLDGGCLWGGNLIALRLEDMALTYLPSNGHQRP